MPQRWWESTQLNSTLLPLFARHIQSIRSHQTVRAVSSSCCPCSPSSRSSWRSSRPCSWLYCAGTQRYHRCSSLYFQTDFSVYSKPVSLKSPLISAEWWFDDLPHLAFLPSLSCLVLPSLDLPSSAPASSPLPPPLRRRPSSSSPPTSCSTCPRAGACHSNRSASIWPRTALLRSSRASSTPRPFPPLSLE